MAYSQKKLSLRVTVIFKITPDHWEKLIRSMPNRLKAVMEKVYQPNIKLNVNLNCYNSYVSYYLHRLLNFNLIQKHFALMLDLHVIGVAIFKFCLL